MEVSQFRAVAFDFDGTLADSIAVHTQARREAFPMCGVNGVTAEQHEQAHRLGNTPSMIIGSLLKEFGHVLPDDTLVALGLKSKPDPDIYIEFAKRIGEMPQDILTIEDSPGEVTAAKLAGLSALAVGSTNPENEFMKAEPTLRPDYFVPSLADIELRYAR